MITKQQLKQAQDINRCVIEVIFQYEKSFKATLLMGNGWLENSYSIERCHMSGSVVRLTLKHEDERQKDLYIPINEVYSWFLKGQDKIMNGEEGDLL